MARTVLAGERLRRSPVLSRSLLLLVSIAWAGPAAPAPVQIEQIRHWSGAEYTRVVLDLSAKPTFREQRSADPPMVTLDITGAMLGAGVESQVIGDGRLGEVRVESRVDAPARVSFILQGKRAVKVFALPPAEGKPHRLVVDILGAPLAVSAEAAATPTVPSLSAPAGPGGDSAAVAGGTPEVSGSLPAGPSASEEGAPPGVGSAPPEAVSAASPQAPAQGAAPTQVASPPPAAPPGQAPAPTPATSVPAAPAKSEPRPRSRPWIVVIDPGHGGEDPGARGPGGLLEKDICLALGRALAADLNRRPGIEAHLTRDKDFFIPLRRRTRIAAEKTADLFVSVHANASRDKSAHGTEVYFLSLRGASDAGAREVAMRENASDLVAGVPPTAQDEIEEILVDLMRTKVLERSSELASTVIDGLQTDNRLVLRGVKQAGFDVLKTASMPSILIEAAFISHSKEAKLMKTKSFQQRFGSMVGGALAEYLARTGAADEAPVEAGAADPPATATARPAGN